MKRVNLIVVLITFFCFNGQAQILDSSNLITIPLKKETRKERKNRPPQKGDISFTPGPVIGANPANGFIFGVGAATSALLGDPENTSLSSALVGISYTSKNQLLLTIKSSVYLPKNNFILNGDWQYLDSSQPTWGLGTGPQSAKLLSTGVKYNDRIYKGVTTEQMLTYNFIRFYQTALTSIVKNFYVGIGVHFDQYSAIDDQMLDLEAAEPAITSFYAYNFKYGFDQDKSNLVGISVNSIYDTRDNQNKPHKGRYANLSFKMNPDWLGSEKSSSTLWLEYRDYWDITKTHNNMLAFWTWGNFTTSGRLPYLLLPYIGSDQFGRSGRPYAYGRFRGQHMVYGETEFRKHLIASKNNQDLIGAVFFLNATTASSEENNIQLFDYLNLGYGVGLRMNISKLARTNLALDYGWGDYGTEGFYLRINETF